MLHSAKPLLNGVTHCQLCQARNRTTAHPLMKAVTFLGDLLITYYLFTTCHRYATESFSSSPEIRNRSEARVYARCWLRTVLCDIKTGQ